MEVMGRAVRQDVTGILASASAGDEVAFARIVEAYDDEMFRVCVAVGRDHAVAADGVQAAWAIAWRKLGTIRDPARLRPWLVAIAANETKTLLRKRQRRSLVEVHPDVSDHPGSLVGNVDPAWGTDPAAGVAAMDLRDALERLDPDDRALLAMRYVAGFNATELAVALGLSPSGTRTRLERLVRRLRQELR
jgi:RNA polymerase sigma factor (sigma-70 family)